MIQCNMCGNSTSAVVCGVTSRLTQSPGHMAAALASQTSVADYLPFVVVEIQPNTHCDTLCGDTQTVLFLSFLHAARAPLAERRRTIAQGCAPMRTYTVSRSSRRYRNTREEAAYAITAHRLSRALPMIRGRNLEWSRGLWRTYPGLALLQPY